MRDLSLHLLDIIQNSIKAGAHKIDVSVEADPDGAILRMTVRDNGSGMSPELLQQVTDPFVTTRTTRSVGLGLSLLQELCSLTGGSLTLTSEVGAGTLLVAELGLESIDRLPLGDLGETWSALIMSCPDLDFRMTLLAPGREMTLDTMQMREQLAAVPLNEPAVLQWIREFVVEQQQKIFGGFLNEIFS